MSQGLVFEGGGEKNGMVVGIVGMDGNVGMLGSGGMDGMVGNVGMLGNGGRAPGLVNDGCVVGNVGCGGLGIDGNGGNVTPGKAGWKQGTWSLRLLITNGIWLEKKAQSGSKCFGLVFEGGGEKNGIVVGIVGMDGMVGSGGMDDMVGIVGMLGSGGMDGMVGNVGLLGSGGRAPGLGNDGCIVGNVGNVGCGRLGIDGNGGNVTPGKDGGIWRR
ncbi:uncharacterized PE-PGRS family protein PE_PGRS46-like [Hibiscus syriacus]|uniref:uncharacterized PE-PGRS family protein PE_PGRS46-like n=1 Tax=Hibiscus syriacus TaxID=106335 RepID=UPI001922C9EE|nr:uncharacterized PE-PGRS family protein PE_PGRS46-like [Hibiscus syriacus]